MLAAPRGFCEENYDNKISQGQKDDFTSNKLGRLQDRWNMPIGLHCIVSCRVPGDDNRHFWALGIEKPGLQTTNKNFKVQQNHGKIQQNHGKIAFPFETLKMARV